MRHQSLLLAGGASLIALFSSFGCSFPDYVFPGPQQAGGGVAMAGAAAQGGAAGAAANSGDSANSGSAGSGGSAGTGGANMGGDGGDAGGGDAPQLPAKCADLTFLPSDCSCADDATHAYAFCATTRPFSLAAAQCTFYDMQLVEIDGAAENAFIVEEANKITTPSEFAYFWIGASTIGTPGTWHWTDGTVFWMGGASGEPVGSRYFNWRTDSPQNTATQSCAFSDDAGWQDGDCTQNRPYVCEAN